MMCLNMCQNTGNCNCVSPKKPAEELPNGSGLTRKELRRLQRGLLLALQVARLERRPLRFCETCSANATNRHWPGFGTPEGEGLSRSRHGVQVRLSKHGIVLNVLNFSSVPRFSISKVFHGYYIRWNRKTSSPKSASTEIEGH
jgi:hypothetical protein